MATMTEKEAYDAMVRFLDQVYERTKSDELGGLLGSMTPLEDGDPADPALKNDWNEAVKAVLESNRQEQHRAAAE